MNRPLISYAFVLLFDNGPTITKQVISFEIDEVEKTFTIIFVVPIDNRDEFVKELRSFTYFYLQEVESNGIVNYEEIYHVKKFIKKHRKYDYSDKDIVRQTIIGIYK